MTSVVTASGVLTASGVVTASGVAAAFRQQVRAHPEREAVALVRNPEAPDATVSWTYARLHEAARAVAAHLTGRWRPGDRILLTYPSGPDFAAAFFGCLYAGLIAVPAPLPMRSRQQKLRLTAIAQDAGVAAVLALSNDREVVEDWLSADELTGVDAVYTDTLPPAPADGVDEPLAEPNGIAFLQYTSGSTGDAKGVVLTQDNVLANSRILFQVTDLPSEQIRLVCWLPLYHDMGLIGQLLSPLLYGGTTFLLDPVTFVRRPFAWLRTIDQYRATVSAAPDFAFGLCVDRISDAEVARLDLSTWRMATNGADWLNLSVMRRFTERFAPAGFRADLCPAYGLAEATLMVASRRDGELRVLNADRAALDAGGYVPADPAEPAGAKQIVSCGPPLDIDLEIVNPNLLEPLPEDQVGEIWLRGRSVARGYWGKEEQTRQLFGARTAAGDGPYLRTGDLGFRHDGELYVTGRIKEVIVVRGLKIYPQDIESVVRAEVPELTGVSAAFRLPGAEENDPDRVVLTYEVRDTPAGRLTELAQRVMHVVAQEFGAQVAAVLFLKPGGVQRTTSGKVKRVEMRERYLAGTLQPVHEYTR
jgi:acyl-CoA synthetase (AMP-forming)/AMP-acid ligase II